ncbi:hypothetical protein MRX96_003910 [Rhipicephalus microplus]
MRACGRRPDRPAISSLAFGRLVSGAWSHRFGTRRTQAHFLRSTQWSTKRDGGLRRPRLVFRAFGGHLNRSSRAQRGEKAESKRRALFLDLPRVAACHNCENNAKECKECAHQHVL